MSFIQTLKRISRPTRVRLARTALRMAGPSLAPIGSVTVPQPEGFAGGKPKFRVAMAEPLDVAIAPRPDWEMRFDPRTALNRLCDISDWRNGRVLELMVELGYRPGIARKAWEEATCLYGLEKLAVIQPEAEIISIGAGMEHSLFWLANRVRRVVATDLYGPEWGFAANDLNELARSRAPIPYPEDHLEVRRMSGADLEFAAGTFDAAYTLSSIEHFGGHDVARRSVMEMSRVLRPGGVACVVTELLLTPIPRPERFTTQELRQYLVDGVGMDLIEEEIDYRISESLLAHPINRHYEVDLSISPHIVLIDANGHVWTSVVLFYRKPVDSSGHLSLAALAEVARKGTAVFPVLSVAINPTATILPSGCTTSAST
jgi:SAM-dependent methyltransferase